MGHRLRVRMILPALTEAKSPFFRPINRDFYGWRSIIKGASAKSDLRGAVRHLAYAAGWKKFEPLWDAAIRRKQVLHALPLLEAILASGRPSKQAGERAAAAPTPLRSAM